MPRTPRDLLRTGGRVVVWCLVGVLLLRGTSDVLATPKPVATTIRARPAPVWPDDAARAFAVGFARAYLSFSPAHRDQYAAGLGAFVSPELAAQLVPRFAAHGSRQVVQAATPARVVVLGRDRALVTVATQVADRHGVSTRWLTVPVARDAGGALAVVDLPSFAARPARATLPLADSAPLAGAQSAAIAEVASRFLAAYLGGRRDELELLMPAGDRIDPLDRPLQIVGSVSVAGAGGSGRARDVLATVDARDPASGSVFPLRFRLGLLRGDRWYVATVNESGRDR